MDLFIDLSQQAPTHGGGVVTLLGNHELMNMQGDLRYVHPQDFADFGGSLNRERAFSENGYYGKWLRSLNATAVIHDTLFCHAGLHPLHAKQGIENINRKFHSALLNIEADNWGLLGMHGPLWTRIFDPRAQEPRLCELVASTLAHVKASRMVVGHSVQESGSPSVLCGGTLVLNDVGICNFYGGSLAATEISGGKVSTISAAPT